MRRFFWPLLVLASCGVPAPEPIQGDLSSVVARGIREGTAGFDHSAWDEILSKYALDSGRRFGMTPFSESLAALVREGATVLREPAGDVDWHVLADPAGNEFCVFTP